jgi:hypothetical protein
VAKVVRGAYVTAIHGSVACREFGSLLYFASNTSPKVFAALARPLDTREQ